MASVTPRVRIGHESPGSGEPEGQPDGPRAESPVLPVYLESLGVRLPPAVWRPASGTTGLPPLDRSAGPAPPASLSFGFTARNGWLAALRRFRLVVSPYAQRQTAGRERRGAGAGRASARPILPRGTPSTLALFRRFCVARPRCRPCILGAGKGRCESCELCGPGASPGRTCGEAGV